MINKQEGPDLSLNVMEEQINVFCSYIIRIVKALWFSSIPCAVCNFEIASKLIQYGMPTITSYSVFTRTNIRTAARQRSIKFSCKSDIS